MKSVACQLGVHSLLVWLTLTAARSDQSANVSLSQHNFDAMMYQEIDATSGLDAISLLQVKGRHASAVAVDASLRSSVIDEVRATMKSGIDWNTVNKLPPWMTSIEQGANQSIAIVLGQSLKPDGSAPQVLLDRARRAKDLLDQGKVIRIVVSGGDPAGVGHTEASAAAKILVEAGIPSESIIQEGQASTTAENAWFTLKWIPKGTGNIYIITSDFHMARATYIFQETFNYFYKMLENSYKDAPEWKSASKKYPRLAILQSPTASFCGSDASRNRDDDPHADINTKSLAKRARDELGYLGSNEVSNAMWGEPLTNILYIWPIEVNVTEDPQNKMNSQQAMAKAMNVVEALCVCKAPPEKEGTELAYPLSFPIATSFPESSTEADWKQVQTSCKE